MGQRIVVGIGLLLVALALSAGFGIATGEVANETTNETVKETTNETAGPTIERAYPNPVASGDVGEYVVLSLHADATLSNATLTDGKTTVPLSDVERRGSVAISTDPEATAKLTDRPVANSSGLQLANTGETLRIHVDGKLEDEFRYGEAPEGKIAVRNGSRVAWRTFGATDFGVATAGSSELEAFVLPDSPDVPAEVLRGAEDRILLGGYTLRSERIASALIRAHDRGVDVRVLLEGNLVGSRTRGEATQLDRLTDAGVDVAVVAGDHARVDYHHAKYAIADDQAIVLTENWKASGTGGNSSRGWGVVTDQPAIVENLTATFEADSGWRDAVPWGEFRAGQTFERGEPSLGQYPTEFDASEIPVDRTELLLTPDNGGDRLVEVIADANRSVDVIQASLGDWDGRFPTALRRAAQRDVDVRILLSSAWYSKEDNQGTVDRFREWAERTDAPLSIKLAEPNGRFEKIHAKGAVVDDDRAVVGSLNWNDAAATSNREVLLVLHGTEAADYYGEVFDADWSSGSSPPLPVGVLVALLGVVLLAGAVLAKIRFEGGSGPSGVDPQSASPNREK